MASHPILLCCLLATILHARCLEESCDAPAADSDGERVLFQIKSSRQRTMQANRSPAGSVQTPLCRVNEAVTGMTLEHNLSFVDYKDYDSTWSLQGLFVSPADKFAFCLIEKNACSTWISTVLQPLLHKADSSEPPPGGHVDYNISGKSQRIFGVQGIEQIFHDPHATRAVFVREPLERFASAYLDKCLGELEFKYNCPASSKNFRTVVEWALQTDVTDASLNGHWRLQAYHCELHKRLRGYNVIGLIEESTFAQDMNCVLTRAGLNSPELSHEVPKVNSGRMNTTNVLQKLFTRDAAQRLIAHFHQDYELFGFPRPAWIEGATGEWFDTEPVLSFAQAGSRQARSGLAMRKEDIDDLTELAYDVGYA